MAPPKSSTDALKTQAELFRQIKGGKFSPLYLFVGAENFLREESLKRLISEAVDDCLRDFNVSEISVAKGNLDDALAIALQYPMMSARRAVVVTGFEALNDEKQLEALKDYLRNPVESTVLIFNSGGLDKRRTIATILTKSCEVVSFDPLDEREAAPRWVNNYVTQAGSFIEPAAASLLIGMVGTELQRLSTELDKLISYVGKKKITRDDVSLLVRYSREHSNFEMTDAMMDGDRRRALTLLDHLFTNPAEPPQTLALMLLGAMASNYRKMLMAKELMRQNAPQSEVQRIVGLPPFLLGKFNERVRRFEMDRIVKGIERLAATDVALKSSLGTPRLQLELLICELCPVR